jgi:hypothetical protein
METIVFHKYSEKQLAVAAARRMLCRYVLGDEILMGKMIGYRSKSDTILLSTYGRHVRIKASSLIVLVTDDTALQPSPE